jgi:hypothetical protein
MTRACHGPTAAAIAAVMPLLLQPHRHGYTRFIEPYQSGPLGVHMHDPSATRPEEVGTMTGQVHLIAGSEGHGW